MGQERSGQVLRAIRLQAGMTQADLGRRLGLSQSTVSRAERGTLAPSREHLAWAAAQWATFPTDPEQSERNMHPNKSRQYAFNAFPQFSTKNARPPWRSRVDDPANSS